MLPLELDIGQPWLDTIWVTQDILLVDSILTRLKQRK